MATTKTTLYLSLTGAFSLLIVSISLLSVCVIPRFENYLPYLVCNTVNLKRYYNLGSYIPQELTLNTAFCFFFLSAAESSLRHQCTKWG